VRLDLESCRGQFSTASRVDRQPSIAAKVADNFSLPYVSGTNGKSGSEMILIGAKVSRNEC